MDYIENTPFVYEFDRNKIEKNVEKNLDRSFYDKIIIDNLVKIIRINEKSFCFRFIPLTSPVPFYLWKVRNYVSNFWNVIVVPELLEGGVVETVGIKLRKKYAFGAYLDLPWPEESKYVILEVNEEIKNIILEKDKGGNLFNFYQKKNTGTRKEISCYACKHGSSFIHKEKIKDIIENKRKYIPNLKNLYASNFNHSVVYNYLNQYTDAKLSEVSDLKNKVSDESTKRFLHSLKDKFCHMKKQDKI